MGGSSSAVNELMKSLSPRRPAMEYCYRSGDSSGLSWDVGEGGARLSERLKEGGGLASDPSAEPTANRSDEKFGCSRAQTTRSVSFKEEREVRAPGSAYQRGDESGSGD